MPPAIWAYTEEGRWSGGGQANWRGSAGCL